MSDILTTRAEAIIKVRSRDVCQQSNIMSLVLDINLVSFMPLAVSFDWLVSSCHKMFFFPRDSRVSKI